MDGINKTRTMIIVLLFFIIAYRIWGIRFLEKIFGRRAYMKGLYEGGIDIGIISLIILLIYSFTK